MEESHRHRTTTLIVGLWMLAMTSPTAAAEWLTAGRVEIEAGQLTEIEIDGRRVVALQELPDVDDFHFDDGFPDTAREDLFFVLEELQGEDCAGGWPLQGDEDCSFRYNLSFGFAGDTRFDRLEVELPAEIPVGTPMRWPLRLRRKSTVPMESLLIVMRSENCVGRRAPDPAAGAAPRSLRELQKRYSLPASEALESVRFLLRCESDTSPVNRRDRRALEEAVVEIFHRARELGFLPGTNDPSGLAGRLERTYLPGLLIPLEPRPDVRVSCPLATPEDWTIDVDGLWRVEDVVLEIEPRPAAEDAEVSHRKRQRSWEKADRRLVRRYLKRTELRDRAPLARLAEKDRELLLGLGSDLRFLGWKRQGGELVATVRWAD